MKIYGLIGKSLKHSFSQTFFNEKFKNRNIPDVSYQMFELQNIEQLNNLINNTPDLCGLNVTIPYKSQVFPFLTHIHSDARRIGAVNCIRIDRTSGKISSTGFNTDAWAFKKSLIPLLKPHHKKALILGTGGGSKAVFHVLHELGIDAIFVSRNPREHTHISYGDVDGGLVREYKLIINTTPLGMFPDTHAQPAIPYEKLERNNLLYDLIYNPDESRFLKSGKAHGAHTKNGLEMLYQQAEKSWHIWQEA